jgi:arginase
MRILTSQGSIGDRFSRGSEGAALLAQAIGKRYRCAIEIVASEGTPFATGYAEALLLARPELQALATATEALLVRNEQFVLTIGRCAGALATLPVVAARHPDAAFLWFDAHGDLNTPESSASGYLGGMVISGAAGLFETGLPVGLSLSNVMLIGAYDLDPFERQLIGEGTVAMAAEGADRLSSIERFITNRPVYIHCDVDCIEPGVLPTGFVMEHGMSLTELHAIAMMIAKHHVIGLEIAEMNGTWPDGRKPELGRFLDAMDPLFQALQP